jgi:DNA-binding MarR family transcriptional regulator
VIAPVPLRRPRRRRSAQRRDYLVSLGALALAARLKRISDRMIQESRLLYRQLEATVEPNWYLVFLLLERYGELSVTEIADALQMAHPSIATVIARMEERGYLEAADNPVDRRQRLLRLSALGHAQLAASRPAWDAVRRGLQQLIDESGGTFLPALDSLEAALTRRGFRHRTLDALRDLEGARPRRE